jgi:hypothetical protein
MQHTLSGWEKHSKLKTMKESNHMTNQGVNGGLRKWNGLMYFGVVQLAGILLSRWCTFGFQIKQIVSDGVNVPQSLRSE